MLVPTLHDFSTVAVEGVSLSHKDSFQWKTTRQAAKRGQAEQIKISTGLCGLGREGWNLSDSLNRCQASFFCTGAGDGIRTRNP